MPLNSGVPLGSVDLEKEECYISLNLENKSPSPS